MSHCDESCNLISEQKVNIAKSGEFEEIDFYFCKDCLGKLGTGSLQLLLTSKLRLFKILALIFKVNKNKVK